MTTLDKQQMFYEPYVPSIGERVRFRWNPECVCRVCGGFAHPKESNRLEYIVEAIFAEGRTGEAKTCGHFFAGVGHRFQVRSMDGTISGTAAAIELEPLEKKRRGAEC